MSTAQGHLLNTTATQTSTGKPEQAKLQRLRREQPRACKLEGPQSTKSTLMKGFQGKQGGHQGPQHSRFDPNVRQHPVLSNILYSPAMVSLLWQPGVASAAQQSHNCPPQLHSCWLLLANCLPNGVHNQAYSPRTAAWLRDRAHWLTSRQHQLSPPIFLDLACAQSLLLV